MSEPPPGFCCSDHQDWSPPSDGSSIAEPGGSVLLNPGSGFGGEGAGGATGLLGAGFPGGLGVLGADGCEGLGEGAAGGVGV